MPLERLSRMAANRRHVSLAAALARPHATSIIAELKKASPSAGLLQPRYRPGVIAERYEAAGAAAVSVLTEPRRFLGDEKHVRSVRRAVRLPILRKDFLCEPYQVVESAAWGADAILIIVAAVDPFEARALYEEALRWGLDVLVEAHTAVEVQQALSFERAIIGVNSRNLKTLRTDLAVARQLAKLIPDYRLSVAESGIRSRSEIEDLQTFGYNGFLIGETLMRAARPEMKLRELLGL